MIELNSKTQQDFLNREWVQKLLDAGVDMSDAKYVLISFNDSDGTETSIYYKEEWEEIEPNSIENHERQFECGIETLPTYTVSELLYKLHELEENNIGNKRCRGDVCFMPDAPYYMTFFHLVGDETVEIFNDMCGMSESPIESLASLLIQCHKKDIGIKVKDTGDISNK